MQGAQQPVPLAQAACSRLQSTACCFENSGSRRPCDDRARPNKGRVCHRSTEAIRSATRSFEWEDSAHQT